MPLVEIMVFEGKSREIKKKLIQNVSETIAETLNIPIEWIEIIIIEVPKENWGCRGGKQVSELSQFKGY